MKDFVIIIHYRKNMWAKFKSYKVNCKSSSLALIEAINLFENSPDKKQDEIIIGAMQFLKQDDEI